MQINPSDVQSTSNKADFQSVLRTLERLFMFFCFDSCKTLQNVSISQLLT